MKHAALGALAVAVTALCAVSAEAQGQRWLGRVRLLGVAPDYHSGDVAGTGTHLKAGDTAGGEASVTYFLDPSWALEASVAAMPMKLSTVSGQYPGLDAGRVTIVSGLLAFQYHFATLGRLKPYLGIGVTGARPIGYTLSADLANQHIANLTFSSSFRVHTQIGADYEIGKGWRLDLDFRYIPLTTRTEFHTTAGGSLGTVAFDLNPVLLGIGIGRSF